MQKGEKIIQIEINSQGQIVALTNKGRLFFQEKIINGEPSSPDYVSKLTWDFILLNPTFKE